VDIKMYRNIQFQTNARNCNRKGEKVGRQRETERKGPEREQKVRKSDHWPKAVRQR
jgi:hypothetical protein